jgi:hypothetical protein
LKNKGSQQYRCNTIRIDSQVGFWNFECNTPIKCPKCSTELTVTNFASYVITVKTSSQDDSGTNMPVYISLLGGSGASPKKLLSENGFVTGTNTVVKIDTKEIENINGINLYMIGYDSWRPEEIIIKKENNLNGICEERVFRNVNNFELNSPDKVLTLKLPKQDGELDESILNKGISNSLLDNKDIESNCRY